jgi:hypothetical protein
VHRRVELVQVQEGFGWRFCVDLQRQPHAVLIGGEAWALELTLAEAAALRRGALQLSAELAAIADQLMAEEAITLEFERGPLWLELEGYPGRCALRFVLQAGEGGRGVEAGWSAAATAPFLAALRQCVDLPDGPADR